VTNFYVNVNTTSSFLFYINHYNFLAAIRGQKCIWKYIRDAKGITFIWSIYAAIYRSKIIAPLIFLIKNLFKILDYDSSYHLKNLCFQLRIWR